MVYVTGKSAYRSCKKTAMNKIKGFVFLRKTTVPTGETSISFKSNNSSFTRRNEKGFSVFSSCCQVLSFGGVSRYDVKL